MCFPQQPNMELIYSGFPKPMKFVIQKYAGKLLDLSVWDNQRFN